MFKLRKIPDEHKAEFHKQLSCTNAKRMIILFLVIACIELLLFIVELLFESNTEGIREIMTIKLLLTGLSLFFAVSLWHFKRNQQYRILRIVIFIAVLMMVLLMVTNTLAAQKLVSDISIYIMGVYIATASIRIAPYKFFIIYSVCFTYFAFGMQTVQLNGTFVKFALINAVILNVIALIITHILYNQTIEIFVDKVKIEEQINTLKHMAEHDGLTNLYNHQAITRIIENQKEISKSFDDSLCLAVIDIDNFKSINDNFGHLMGDQVLKEISRKIKENVRECDYVARFGGDEFIVLFPNVKIADANMICVRILNALKELGPTTDGITGSIGLISLDDHNYHDFVEAADLKMYQAKTSGKAQIIC